MRAPAFLLASCLLASAAFADVKLPALISDNMVLMPETEANVWGWADPQEEVTVTFGDKSAKTTTDVGGKWAVKLSGLKAGTVGELTVQGKNQLTIKNVAVGEVWVASGQSNMEWVVQGALNPEEEKKAANYPLLRMFTVKKAPMAEPQENCEGKWEVCTPATVGHFSAVGYFFAREVHTRLQQPVGIIHSSWGGTAAELWTPSEVLAADDDLSATFKYWDTLKKSFPDNLAKYEEAKAAHPAAVEKAKAEGRPIPNPPNRPKGDTLLGMPGGLYNGMIHPLIPHTIRGAIWYQGESNAGAAKLYRKLFPTMISSWRTRWGQEFPFLYVQLANWMARKPEPGPSNWAMLREAQLRTLQLPHTGMAVAIDIGEAADIHPKNKQEVGRRLALNALATVYFQEVEYSGPLFVSAQEEEGKIRVTFRFAEGLRTTDGKAPAGFAIAGEDKKWVWATAELQGDHVVLSSPQVPKPVAVRYAWADNPEINLVNSANLPASPFRTDEWEN